MDSGKIIIEPSNIKGKFHFLSTSSKELDCFIDNVLFPLLLSFKRPEKPKVINRQLRKEDYGLSESYVDDMLRSASGYEQKVALNNYSTTGRSYAQAADKTKVNTSKNNTTNTVTKKIVPFRRV